MLLLLLLALVFELPLSRSTQTHEATCGADVFLPCNTNFNDIKYFSVTWYKNDKEGIIRKVLEDGTIRLYNFPRTVSLNEQNGLLLQKVTAEDSGRYECAVSAHVGGQNLNLFVRLTVPECEPDTTVSPTTLASVQTEWTCVNGTHSGAPHLPLAWSLIGYSIVGLTKVILSLIIIWIFHIWSRRKRRW